MSSAITSALSTGAKGFETTQPATLGNRTPLRMRHPDFTGTTTSDEKPLEDSTTSSSSENEYDSEGGETTAVDEENYVKKVLAKEKPLPPITMQNWWKEINVVSTLVLTLVPALSFYGAFTTELQTKTLIWSIAYYYFTGLGITAGYHRLWAHRSYTASKPLQYFLALGGSGAVEGSIKWWSRGHRAHHRYTDTDLDPYSAHKGLLWSHVGWMILKPRRKPGMADVSDLSRNEVVKWQHKYYLPLIAMMGFALPTLVAGLGWGDWAGGFFFAGAARLMFVHHSTFCVNSLAHWLGESPFDDKHSPRDHVITALVTIGEGYHNFHHEFPQDFRNAVKTFQYDPTKWFIIVAYWLGLASQLKTFPDNEIKKGQLAMALKKLQVASKTIEWPTTSNDLPVLSWDEFQTASETRELVVIGGFIHDVSEFMAEHPGGKHFIKTRLGKDATSAFYGGVYDHSNGANNVLAMLRVGAISGGYEVESLKKYSAVIEVLKHDGDTGTMGKAGDLGKGTKTPMVVIQPKENSSHVLKDKVNHVEFNSDRLVGGL